MRLCAEVAQSVEHSAENAGVASSILALGTPGASVAGGPEGQASGSGSVVERLLAKEKVTGSTPVFRSNPIV